MRLRSFLDQVAALPEEPSAYMAYLAAPDTVEGDSIEIQLVPVVRVEWDDGAKIVRLYPELPDSDDGTMPTVDDLMANFPPDSEITPEVRLQVQIPIVRSGAGYYHLGFIEIPEIVIGLESKELWLLTKPRKEYPAEELPA